jgi:uncharacterized protein YecT (DUF1311 family)
MALSKESYNLKNNFIDIDNDQSSIKDCDSSHGNPSSCISCTGSDDSEVNDHYDHHTMEQAQRHQDLIKFQRTLKKSTQNLISFNDSKFKNVQDHEFLKKILKKPIGKRSTQEVPFISYLLK